MLILIGTFNSPYTRKVRLALLECMIPHEFVIDLPRDVGSKIALFNPLRRVPVLVLENGTCVFDSPVITDYIDGVVGGKLIPLDLHSRMLVKRWEAIADGIMDSAVQVRIELERSVESQDYNLINKYNYSIYLALYFVNSELQNKKFCHGDSISLADLALVSAMIYLDLRQPNRNWRIQYENIYRWFEGISVYDSVQKSLVENKIDV